MFIGPGIFYVKRGKRPMGKTHLHLPVTYLAFVLWLGLAPFSGAFGEDRALPLIEKPVLDSIDIRADTQKKIDAWEKEKARLVSRYDELGRDNKRLKERLGELSGRAKKLESLNRSLEKRIADSVKISQELRPFLVSVYDRVYKFVQSDLPFLATERRERLDRFKRALDDPSKGVNDAFKRMMETLFAEADYGNSCEVYQDKVSLDGRDMLVNVFRLGRVALFCCTPDGRVAGYFNVAGSKWNTLPSGWNHEIGTAVEMVQKRRPMELLYLPVGRLSARQVSDD